MGVLADFAATLFPDYVAETSIPYSPSLSNLRSFAAAIDNAIPNAQNLSGEQSRAEAAEADLGERISGEIAARQGLQEQFQGTFRIAQDALDTAAAASASASDASASASASASAAAAEAEVISEKFAALSVELLLAPRPGDMPAAFTVDIASGISGVPPGAQPVAGPFGTALLIPGPFTLAPTALVAIEPNRTYKARTAFRRTADAQDPAGGATRFAAAWYGADRNQLPQGFSVIADVSTTVAAGRVQYEVLFSLNPPDQADLANPRVAQPPAGTCYFRPFLQAWGGAVQTAVEVLTATDVTDAALVTLDLDAVLARLARCEAALNLPSM